LGRVQKSKVMGMMFKEHIARDMELFGYEFPEVHKALDSTFSQIGHPHRKDTHYLEWVLRKWEEDDVGESEWSIDQVRSAIQHIIDDCGHIMLYDDWLTGPEIIEKDKWR